MLPKVRAKAQEIPLFRVYDGAPSSIQRLEHVDNDNTKNELRLDSAAVFYHCMVDF